MLHAAAAYMATKGDESSWDEFRRRYIDGPQDHMAYLEQLSLRRLFSLNEF
jgi:glutaconate CoA-transferase subunit A